MVKVKTKSNADPRSGFRSMGRSGYQRVVAELQSKRRGLFKEVGRRREPDLFKPEIDETVCPYCGRKLGRTPIGRPTKGRKRSKTTARKTAARKRAAQETTAT